MNCRKRITERNQQSITLLSQQENGCAEAQRAELLERQLEGAIKLLRVRNKQGPERTLAISPRADARATSYLSLLLSLQSSYQAISFPTRLFWPLHSGFYPFLFVPSGLLQSTGKEEGRLPLQLLNLTSVT